MLTACGNNSVYNDFTINDLKKFISEEKTGFILYTYDADNEKVNKEQVREALEKYNQKAKYFNYRKLVTNKQSQTFQKDVGSKQSRDSLAYYKSGVLMSEFQFPNKWTPGEIENLNKFIEKNE